jgi:tRNA(Ile)-lysidine synthase
MRFLRGAGLDGLSGIPERRGRYLRPLLAVSRGQIAAWAKATGVRFREDDTNAKDTYLRNRVRLKVMPEILRLASEFGGRERFYVRAAGTLGELRSERARLTARAAARFKRDAVVTDFWVRVPSERFLTWGTLRGRILRKIVASLGADPLARTELLRAEKALLLGKKLTLPGDLTVISSCGQIFFQSRAQREKLQRGIPIETHGRTVEIPQLGLKLVKHTSDGKVRFFRPGDRKGSKKLKRLFLERRVPLPERAIVPLLADGRGVRWIFPEPCEGVTVESVTFPFTFR